MLTIHNPVQHPKLCTGTLPASLGSQSSLGVLRVGGNKLEGSLEAFAAAIHPESMLFDFNASYNGITGPLPEALQDLGMFNASVKITANTPSGLMPAVRSLDLTNVALEGDFPAWLLSTVSSFEEKMWREC